MNTVELPESIIFNAQFDDITPVMEEDLEKIAKEHLIKFSDSYLKPFLTKPDATITVMMRMSKNKQEKYEGKFQFLLDGETFYRNNDVPFKEPYDVVNHAFKHLKEYLANK